MNSRRWLHLWPLHAHYTWWRLLQTPAHAAIFFSGVLFLLAQQRCSSALLPIPVSREYMFELLHANPYDLCYPDLQQQVLAFARRGQRDEIPSVLAGRPYATGVVFHIFLEKSLRLQFFVQNDSAKLYAEIAARLARFMAQAQGDSFLLHRHKRLQDNAQRDPEWLRQWLLTNAVFIRALNLGPDDCALKVRCLEFARAQFQTLGDEKKVVDTYWLAHFFLDKQGERAFRLQAAITKWLALAQAIGYRDGELEAYLARAEKFGDAGQSDSSLAYHQRAETLAVHIGKTITPAHVIDGEVYEAMQRGDLNHAFALTQKGLQYCRAQGFRYVEADLLEKLALIYHLRQEYQSALNTLEAAMALHREVAKRIDLPPLFLAQAKIFLDLHELSAAQVAADSARQIYLALQKPIGLAKTYGVLGLIHAREKNWRRAIAFEQLGLEQLAQADTIPEVIELWARLGELRLQVNDTASARAAFAHALQLSLKLEAPLSQAQAYLGLGRIALGQAQWDSASAYLEKALDLAQATNQREVLWHCHFSLARFYERQGRHDLALRNYESAIHELERIRTSLARLEFSLSYFSAVQEVFDCALAFAVNVLKDEKLALRFMEQGRGRNVLARLERGRPESHFDYAQSSFDPRGLLNTFDDSTGLLEYRVTDEATYLAFITRGEIKTFRLPITRAEVERMVLDLRQTLGVEERETFERRLRHDRPALIAETERACGNVYQQVLAPIAPQLRAVRTLYIVPDGPLYYLPFAALQRVAGGAFLAETMDLAYAPSLCALKVLREQTPAFDAERMRQALVLAMKSETIPSAVAEACAVAQMLAGTKEKIYDRLSRAELRALLESPYALIHLALHADLND